MGDIKRLVQVGSTEIADGALDTVDIKDASVTPAKLEEKLEHGTVSGVTATGRYKVFDAAFGGVPDVVCYENKSIESRLMGTATLGSFQVQLSATGTQDLTFMAWGNR